MLLNKIPVGDNVPELVNVIIEIPMNSDPVKYEFDEDSQCIWVDRFIPVAMYYPCNYGFIPHTLGGDNDPIDVLVISPCPIMPSAVVKVRPIGVLIMEDESGMDEKIIAVPKSDLYSAHIKNISDIPQILQDQIKHFFENYKKLEKEKWVVVHNYDNAAKAKELIVKAVERATNNASLS